LTTIISSHITKSLLQSTESKAVKDQGLSLVYNQSKGQTADFSKIKMTVCKLKCNSSEYYYVQDTKRDWYGIELKILAEIHLKIFKDHIMAVTEISDEELREVITTRRIQIAIKRRQNVSNVSECMKDLSKLERDSLEALWEEYSK
jgi:hypothetical protein